MRFRGYKSEDVSPILSDPNNTQSVILIGKDVRLQASGFNMKALLLIGEIRNNFNIPVRQGLSIFTSETGYPGNQDVETQLELSTLKTIAPRIIGKSHVASIASGTQRPEITGYSHLLFWVHELLRGKGLSQKLFDEYTKLFGRPKTEIVPNADILGFFAKNGFVPTKIHVPFIDYKNTKNGKFVTYDVSPTLAAAILEAIKNRSITLFPFYVEMTDIQNDKVKKEEQNGIIDDEEVERVRSQLEYFSKELGNDPSKFYYLNLDTLHTLEESLGLIPFLSGYSFSQQSMFLVRDVYATIVQKLGKFGITLPSPYKV